MIDLRALAAVLWRGKWIVVVAMLIAGVLALLAVSRMEPRWFASARVLFDPPRAQVINLQDVFGNPEFDKDSLQNQIEVLRSTSLMDRLIDELDLEALPEFNPALRPPPEGLSAALAEIGLWPREVLRDLGVLPPQGPPPLPEEAARILRLDVIAGLRAGLTLRPIPNSRVIEIGFTAGDPRLAARVVNTLIEQYIIEQLDAKLEATRSATVWLSSRVDELRVRVQTAEEAVETARAELSLDAGQGLEITRQQLSELNAALTEAQGALTALEARYARVVQALEEQADFGTISDFRASAIIQEYRGQESELVAQRAGISRSVPEGHPALARIDSQLAEVRTRIAAEAGRIAQALAADMDAARGQLGRLVSQVRTLEEKALEQARAEVRLRQLEREAQASKVLYETFLGRMKETSEQQDLQSADARLLSPAEVPLVAIAERKRVILAGALVFGALLGLGVVILLDRLNNTFRGPGQLESLAGLAVFGTLPRLGRRMSRSHVLAHLREKPASALAEAVRNLRTSILFSNIDNPPKVVMFTSTVPREGKTTTAMLVALTSRQMGKAAIVVDCDLRLPALSSLLGDSDERPGLLSVLDGSATLREALYIDEATGLHVLTARPSERKAHVNPADILSTRRFRDLVAELASTYELVVLDLPPVLVVPDARIVAGLADAVIYAVRWDSTPRGAVMEGLSELHSVKAPVAGLVMTMINEARAGSYSYGRYGYYRGKYRDYYTE